MTAGANVDIVPQNPYQWKEIADSSFDAVISGQAFEHIEFFWVTAVEMARAIKPGGLLCIIAPRGFNRHRHPVDCYRFDADGMIAIARWCNLHVLHASTAMAPDGAPSDWNSRGSEDSLLVACKPYDWRGPVDPGSYVFVAPDIKRTAGHFKACS